MSSATKTQTFDSSASKPEVTEPTGRHWTHRLGSEIRGIIREFNKGQLPSGRWVIVLAIACVVALGVSGYLSWVALTSSKVAGCGGGRIFNCSHVISSRWSLWLGIPVSVLAFGLYASMGVSLLVGVSTRFSQEIRHVAWSIVAVLAMFAGVAAVWFIVLQVFVLNHLCTYCLAAHACGLLTAEIVIRQKAIGENAKGLAIIIGAIGLSILVVGQLLGPEPVPYRIETFETPATAPEVFEFEAPGVNSEDSTLLEAPSASEPLLNSNENKVSFALPAQAATLFAILRPETLLVTQVKADPQEKANAVSASSAKQKDSTESDSSEPASERRFVSINGGAVKLDVAQWPIAGSQKAKYIYVEMFDYSCQHCRNTHAAIKKASEKLNGDVAVVALPVPLNATCNRQIQVTDSKFTESCEIAKLAFAVWRVDRKKFTDFHNWMFSESAAPSYAAAKAQADTLVDPTKLNAELATKTPGQYVAQTVELYKRAGSGNVPKLMFAGTTIVGEFTSGDSLVEIIKQQAR